MAVAQIVPPPVPERVGAVVDELVARCLDSGEVPSAAITDDDLEQLDKEERRFVLRVGLIDLVNTALHVTRSRGDASSGGARSPIHAVHGRNPAVPWVALTLSHQGADGALKPLLEFTAGDLSHLATSAEAQRMAWSKRKSWATAALGAVRKARAEKLADLPAETLAELDEAAKEAWGRA